MGTWAARVPVRRRGVRRRPNPEGAGERWRRQGWLSLHSRDVVGALRALAAGYPPYLIPDGLLARICSKRLARAVSGGRYVVTMEGWDLLRGEIAAEKPARKRYRNHFGYRVEVEDDPE